MAPQQQLTLAAFHRQETISELISLYSSTPDPDSRRPSHDNNGHFSQPNTAVSSMMDFDFDLYNPFNDQELSQSLAYEMAANRPFLKARSSKATLVSTNGSEAFEIRPSPLPKQTMFVDELLSPEERKAMEERNKHVDQVKHNFGLLYPAPWILDNDKNRRGLKKLYYRILVSIGMKRKNRILNFQERFEIWSELRRLRRGGKDWKYNVCFMIYGKIIHQPCFQKQDWSQPTI